MRLIAYLLAVCLIVPACARAQERAGSTKPQEHARALARACDELINSAVKRPYGWAWGDAEEAAAPDDGPKKPARKDLFPVSLEPGTTPAAGLVLLYAADVLGEPKYAGAARHVGRGIAAAQQSRGNFPASALFGRTSASAKEPATPLPDRGPTRAALGLLLSLVHASEKAPQDAVTRAAPRGAQWLLRQQAESGGWPVLHPPGAAPQNATRIVRLDTPDTRDSVLAMLLAYEVLGDAAHRRAAERSLDFLTKVRTGAAAESGPGLWQTAYTPSALPLETMPTDFPPGADALASRHCMQTYFATWAVLGDGQRLTACDRAAQSLGDLIKSADGQWQRRFDPEGDAAAAAKSEEEDRGPLFGRPGGDKVEKGDPGLAPTLRSIAQAKALGREKYREQLAASFTPEQHLAGVLVGLSDGPVTLDFPQARDEAEGYVKQHDERFRLAGGAGVPPELRGKVPRLWAMYLRAKVEKEFGI